VRGARLEGALSAAGVDTGVADTDADPATGRVCPVDARHGNLAPRSRSGVAASTGDSVARPPGGEASSAALSRSSDGQLNTCADPRTSSDPRAMEPSAASDAAACAATSAAAAALRSLAGGRGEWAEV
jgi:hypothetical protein